MKNSACPYLFAVLLLLLAGCARFANPSSMAICGGCPKPTKESVNMHLVKSTLLSPMVRSVNIFRTGRRLVRKPVPAENLKLGEVQNSAFLEARRPSELSPKQIRLGPTDPNELPAPPYHIRKIKDEGKTAGFFVRDAKGNDYLFKLDGINNPGLLSGAEVVTSKLLHALGYRVPSYEIVSAQVHEFILTEKVKDKAELLTRLLNERLQQGHVRVAASRLIEGEILGSPRFKQFMDCAGVRALRLAYAWVNNIDTKDHNALLVKEDNHDVVYLIDFGSSFGADASSGQTKVPCSGWRYVFDVKGFVQRVFTLGMIPPKCDYNEPFSPAIGRYSADYDPERWRPYAYNRTFLEMTQADAAWIAGRLSEFTREQIEAAVAAGQYSDPKDVAYLVETLIARRDKIVERYGEPK